MSLEQEVEPSGRFHLRQDPAGDAEARWLSAERLTFSAGRSCSAGDMGDAAYVIIEGKVEISVPTPSGPIGRHFGRPKRHHRRIAIFGDVPRTAATAVGKLETLRISKELFEKIIRENQCLGSFVFWPDAWPNTAAQLSRTTTR